MIDPTPAFDAGSFFGGLVLGAVCGAIAMIAMMWPAVLCRDYANDTEPTESGTRPL
jgi:hypothetical protein